MAFTPSPFPGMDPWLERSWGDVHHTVISRLSDQIAEGLPDDLVVVVEERVVVLDPDNPGGQFMPDAAVVGGRGRRRDTRAVWAVDQGAVAVAEPVRIPIPYESETVGAIEIRHAGPGRPPVTAVEVLSPTNKFDARGRRDYRRKRRAYVRADANVVEVDLLRGGPTAVGLPNGAGRVGPAAAYRCVVRRGGRAASEVEYQPIGLRERLPWLRVPLRPTDDDVVIDLQPPIDHVYKRGRYDLQIDYARPPDPPLSAADAAWAAERVAGQGSRRSEGEDDR